MSTPILALLIFALWTLALLFTTVGWYRWSRILSGKAPINSFRADDPQGELWYLRAMRAHANCIENLPVFAAIVLAVHELGITNNFIDQLTVLIVVARIVQSLIHVASNETNRSVSARFVFYFIQIVAMSAIAVLMLVNHF